MGSDGGEVGSACRASFTPRAAHRLKCAADKAAAKNMNLFFFSDRRVGGLRRILCRCLFVLDI